MADYFFPDAKTIRYVSAPCSTGKTRAACRHIEEKQHLTDHLYVAPTIELVNQTARELKSLGVEPKVITGKTQPNHVKGEIIRFLKDVPDVGIVLLITWNAFVDLHYFPQREQWTIINDEVPQIDDFYRLTVPVNYGFLEEQLELLPTEYEGLAVVAAKDPDCLRQLVDGPHDDVHKLFRPLYLDVLSPQKTVYADTASWERIVELQDISKRHEENSTYFFRCSTPAR
jgi:hypothetical protein